MADTGPIPIVDLSPCVSHGSTEERQEVAKKICDAFRTIGFVYLVNHGIPREQLDAALRTTKKFFMLPPEVKRKYARPPSGSNHGWVCLERESLNPERPGDYKEAYNATPQSVTDWPNDVVAGFQDDVMIFHESAGRLALLVLKLMAEGLGLRDPEEFTKCHSFNNPDISNVSTVRSLYYPPLPENIDLKVDQVRCGEHSDYGSITLLFQDNVGGLEVRNRDGKYLPATPIEGAVVVNIGDLMQRWTSDNLVSTKHRVMIPPEELHRKQERQSLAFFCHPDNDYIIRCVDGSDRYEPISSIDYLNMRFAATY